MKNNVLIIDADAENCRQIKYNLINADTDVYYIHAISEGMNMIQENSYSLIILDVLLTENCEVDVLCEVRKITDCSLLVLSEHAGPAHRTMAIKYGADDVLTKPFDLEECLARSLSLIHRFTNRHPIGRKYAVVGEQPLLLDTEKRMVSISGEEIKLTKKEYEILLYMLINRNQVVSLTQIFNAVWDDDTKDASVVPYHVHNLRKKIGGDWIENVYGVGYRTRSPM